MKTKMRRLGTAWRKSASRAGEGRKILQPPPSLVRALLSQERRSFRALVRRVEKYAKNEYGITPASPTPVPSTSETSTPPETFEGFSSTTSSPPAGKTLYSEQFLSGLLCDRLRDMAKGHGITGYSKMRKADLVAALMGTNDHE